jgi:drug/metabolite transporter (DMT)-like permease
MLAAFGAAAIWGGMYVVSKYVLDFIPPLTLVAVRLAIAAAALTALLRLAGRHRPPGRALPRLVLCGVVGFGVSLTAQFAGTRLSTAHDGALITSAAPAFIAIFAALLLRERVSSGRWLAIALATAGVIVAGLGAGQGTGPTGSADPTSDDVARSPLAGNALLFLAAITWALYSVLAKSAMATHSALVVTTYAALGGLLFTAPAALLEGPALARIDWRALPAAAWWGVPYLGLVSTAVAFYLWNKAFERLDASAAALFFFVQPVVGSLLGWLLLGEHLPPPFLLGAALIAAGVLLASTPDRVRSTAPHPAAAA